MGILPANEALEKLKEGNRLFRDGHPVDGVRIGGHYAELTKSQHPFAVILSCSDSRVPLEIIFHTGLGDLFVIRVAGNVANQTSIASIEYAVKHLGTKLVVVMAHQNCGAVAATIEGGDRGPHLNYLMSYIEPALEPPEPDADLIARRNARNSAARLRDDSAIISSAVENDDVKIATAFFNFNNGRVEFD